MGFYFDRKSTLCQKSDKIQQISNAVQSLYCVWKLLRICHMSSYVIFVIKNLIQNSYLYLTIWFYGNTCTFRVWKLAAMSTFLKYSPVHSGVIIIKTPRKIISGPHTISDCFRPLRGNIYYWNSNSIFYAKSCWVQGTAP